MLKLGTTTLPLAGWLADASNPDQSRKLRLDAIQQVTTGLGLSAVELTMDLAQLFPQVFDAGFFAAVADLQQESGFVCTAHLPFLWVDAASMNEGMRQATSRCLKQAVELIGAVEVETYVLHLWGLTTALVADELDRPEQREAALALIASQAMRSLSELAELVPVRDLCVENLEDPLFDLLWPQLEGQGISICQDVGHLAWREMNEQEFLARHADSIREIHLHDALRIQAGDLVKVRDHLALGQGEVDYAGFLRSLEAMSYNGTIILEVNSLPDLEVSLERLTPFV